MLIVWVSPEPRKRVKRLTRYQLEFWTAGPEPPARANFIKSFTETNKTPHGSTKAKNGPVL